MNDRMHTLMESIEKDFSEIGLYYLGSQIMASDSVHADVEGPDDLEKALVDNPGGFMLGCKFDIGDRAFTDRVLNPEAYDEDVQFKMIVPSEAELLTDRLIANEGKSILDMFNDEED